MIVIGGARRSIDCYANRVVEYFFKEPPRIPNDNDVGVITNIPRNPLHLYQPVYTYQLIFHV